MKWIWGAAAVLLSLAATFGAFVAVSGGSAPQNAEMWGASTFCLILAIQLWKAVSRAR